MSDSTASELSLAATVDRVAVPTGYRGKIVLLSVRCGNDEIIILRGGDLWHREILRNAETEIRALGFPDARVDALGGAHLWFEGDTSIVIWGTSDEMGACDHEYAATLVRAAWPGHTVIVAQ